MWDWNWLLFGGYCVLCFILGLIAHAIGIPGVFIVFIVAIIGFCAGNWEWFEAHGGNNDY